MSLRVYTRSITIPTTTGWAWHSFGNFPYSLLSPVTLSRCCSKNAPPPSCSSEPLSRQYPTTVEASTTASRAAVKGPFRVARLSRLRPPSLPRPRPRRLGVPRLPAPSLLLQERPMLSTARGRRAVRPARPLANGTTCLTWRSAASSMPTTTTQRA